MIVAPFCSVYTIVAERKIIVYVKCHGARKLKEDANEIRCGREVAFVGHFKGLASIVRFEALDECPHCFFDYGRECGGIQPGRHTAEWWIDVALRGAAAFAASEGRDCLKEDAMKKVHIPSNKRTHSGKGKRRRDKNPQKTEYDQIYGTGA